VDLKKTLESQNAFKCVNIKYDNICAYKKLLKCVNIKSPLTCVAIKADYLKLHEYM